MQESKEAATYLFALRVVVLQLRLDG